MLTVGMGTQLDTKIYHNDAIFVCRDGERERERAQEKPNRFHRSKGSIGVAFAQLERTTSDNLFGCTSKRHAIEKEMTKKREKTHMK